MPMYQLVCDCESTNFEYDPVNDVFTCAECGTEYDADDAGHNLVAIDE